MSTQKRKREALALAKAILAERKLQLTIAISNGKHMCLILTAPSTQKSKRVFFAATPSCSRWSLHLKTGLRRAARELQEPSIPS